MLCDFYGTILFSIAKIGLISLISPYLEKILDAIIH